MRRFAGRWAPLLWAMVAAVGADGPRAEESLRGEPIEIHRTTGPIEIDADLSDAGWQGATRVETWFETNPGDNLPAKVKNVGLLAYDDRFFYAAFDFFDPEPSRIRAPFADRDNIAGFIDYGGVILDTRNDGKTGLLLLTSPRGMQYDAVTDDTTGNEDSSPDFFWDSKARITDHGWILEMRVPFSSLRYPKGDPQTWGVLLYRNYPREFRYQMFSAKLPRGGNCFICRSNTLTGLSGVSSAGHLVVAPYATVTEAGRPRDGLGSPLVNEPAEADAGLDLKWTPSARTCVDATVNPDFSQVESDVAQISANERFALFFPEKRPFFLEGVELFSTPIQAVYTRTITSPRWGGRVTGKLDRTAYTALVAEDRGGGLVILPGPDFSNLAEQDFGSYVFIGRVRQDFGNSFVSFLATDREVKSDGGGGSNRVFGPDFQWRPNATDTVTGQFLLSRTVTPERPDLAGEWNGQRLSSHAADVWWSHSTPKLDLFADYKDYGDRFRADDGFVPQVGFRETYGEGGYTFRPTGFLNRIRTFLIADRTVDSGGDLLFRQISPGAGMDGRWSSFGRFRLAFDRVRSGEKTFPRRRFIYTLQVSPSRAVSQITLDGSFGQEIDFANSRLGDGSRISLRSVFHPTDHLELIFNGERRWLDVDAEGEVEGGRLFTAQLSRLRAVYTFTSRAFLRGIGQYLETKRDPSLYIPQCPDPECDPRLFVPEKSASFSGSLLFAYKLNWQSVMFVGYGDDRELTPDDRLEKSGRQFFLKLSYAFQR